MGRDVLIESMRRGQLPLLAFASILVLVLWKTPNDYYPQLWERAFELRGSIMCASVMLNVFLTFGWYLNAKSLRRRFKDENARIVAERNALQLRLGIPIMTSEK